MYQRLKKVYLSVAKKKWEKYLQALIINGLQVGKEVQINDGCFLDPSHCFLISIGAHSTLAPNVRLVAHDASTKNTLGFTKIGRISILENCFLGDSTIVLPGVTIGPDSIIGAGSVVTKDIPPGMVAVGNPAKIICSSVEYLDRQKKMSEERGVLGEEYWIQNITKSKIKWLKDFVEKRVGYVK